MGETWGMGFGADIIMGYRVKVRRTDIVIACRQIPFRNAVGVALFTCCAIKKPATFHKGKSGLKNGVN
jgi:hypothetical protein